MANLDQRFLAIDTEGSGGSVPEILELAAIEFDLSGREYARHRWLIRPRGKIHFHAWKVHGLTAEKLEKCPWLEDVADEIREVLDLRKIVAHNASVDVNILKRSVPSWKPESVSDTLDMARRHLPKLPSYSLRNVIEYLELSDQPGSEKHGALTDALLCKELFLHLYAKEMPQLTLL